MNDDTSLFDVDVVNAKLVKSTLDEVALALKERGYDPVKQIVGYLISGDPGYISNYKNSRNKIQELFFSFYTNPLLCCANLSFYQILSHILNIIITKK